MSKSAMLRVRDICAAYRLIGDCRDVGGDHTQWQQVAFEGVCRLIGAVAATGGEGMWVRPSQPVRPMTSFCVGLDEIGRERFFAYMREHGTGADPIFGRLQHVSDQIVTRTRRELVPNRDWYDSVSFNEYRKLGNVDDQLTSVYQVSPEGAVSSLCVLRAVGERAFSRRERQLTSFFHAELGRLIGRALVSGVDPTVAPLSPRLRQTLACLLEGDSEKQVAWRLGLSRWTVHEYVTMLYRRFGVRSRAALLSHVLARRQVLPDLSRATAFSAARSSDEQPKVEPGRTLRRPGRTTVT
jgi:DNA-binding CsgD family transcriptional regulator